MLVDAEASTNAQRITDMGAGSTVLSRSSLSAIWERTNLECSRKWPSTNRSPEISRRRAGEWQAVPQPDIQTIRESAFTSDGVGRDSNGAASSIDGEFGAVNEAGTVRRQKDNCLGNLVRCSRAACRRLGS
jgi:hypothetical protein